MRDVKALLKEAKEAIKVKDFYISTRICKTILKEDKNNYLGLVFYGVSLQDNLQAKNAFQTAIRLNEENPLAWNGLISFLEKYDKNNTNDLVEAYLKVLKHETNEKRVFEMLEKITTLSNTENASSIIEGFSNLIEKTGKYVEIYTAIVEVLSKFDNLPAGFTEKYEEALKVVLKNPKTICTEFHANYLKLLYNEERIDELLVEANNMHSLFELDTVSLKFICRIVSENYFKTGKILEKETIDNTIQSLLKLDSKSREAILTKSILLFNEFKYEECECLLKDSAITKNELLLLSECYIKLNNNSEALKVLRKIETLLKPNEKCLEFLKLKIQALSTSKNENDLKQVVDIYLENKNESLTQFAIRACIKLEDYTRANMLLDDIKNNQTLFALLSAQLLKNQKKYQQALEILQNSNDPNTSEWYLELGEIYYLCDFKNCLTPFLKAAKLDPNNYECFQKLSKYYSEIGDLDKARRCLEKSFKMNPNSVEIAMELSEIYRRLKNWESNFALLKTLTKSVINNENHWAYLQFGLSYLEQKDYESAITYLRLVIRVDDKNMHCWESLADAYLAKGAYTSALKCYKIAGEISPDAIYPLLQQANIKQVLGEYIEARDDFEAILSRHDSNYTIPALKGISQTALNQAKQCCQQQRFGAAQVHAQFATEKLIIALKDNRGAVLSCLWKLLGDCCMLVTQLPEKNRCLMFDPNLNDENSYLEEEELYSFALKAFGKTLQLTQNTSGQFLLWHDLALCYLEYSQFSIDEKLKEELIEKAERITSYCVHENPMYWQHWNLLGVIVVRKKVADYRLAQHAFIKALTVNNKSTQSWCNLGALYLEMGESKLANQAFAQSQKSDPNYVNSWIGQAILAENFKNDFEAMDLFRHTTQLGYHSEGALGYAHWVCKTLKKNNNLALKQTIPAACDNLTWYTENNPEDATAWNLLGVLRERLGLKKGANEAYAASLVYTENPIHKDLVRINYARTLPNPADSIEHLNCIETVSLQSACALALAYFQKQDYEKSYETYESELNRLTSDEETTSSQSELLVALASMAYMFQGPDYAKTLLYQSLKLGENTSPWCYYSTLALGLVSNDEVLADLVFRDMEKLKNRPNCLEHYAKLCSFYYIIKGDFNKAKTEICKLLHQYPGEACIWNTLAIILIYKNQFKLVPRCCEKALLLGQTTIDVTKIHSLISFASLALNDTKTGLLSIQKAIHTYPDVLENWSLLACLRREKRQAILAHVATTGEQNSPLTQWAIDSLGSLCLNKS